MFQCPFLKSTEKNPEVSQRCLFAEGPVVTVQAGMVFPALVLEPDELKVNVSTVQFSSSPSSQATSSKI